MTWVLLPLLALATLHFLPFIDVDLAYRLQWWLRDAQRRLQKRIQDLEREDRS